MLRKLPYGANYLSLAEMPELRDAIGERILFRYQTIGESAATRFERTVTERLGVRHALAVHNCTEALRLALLATQPSVGDVVYIPAVTFVAVAGAVLSCGLIPVLVDIGQDLSLDPALLPSDAERVIVAHMEGVIGPLPAGVKFVIEDTAQAFGARFPDGSFAGTTGYAGAFSFHHNKILTSGEGGLLITDDSERFDLMRKYHDHGSNRMQGEYPRWAPEAFYGENCVTSEPIAAIQLQQLRHLDEIHLGLERGYRILRERIPHSGSYRILERSTGDAKLSLRIEFGTAELRELTGALLRDQGLPFWTLDRYFLPAHPVLARRRSIYADGFPWNLTSVPRPREDTFAATRERLSRILCLSVSPELAEREQMWEACAFSHVLAKI